MGSGATGPTVDGHVTSASWTRPRRPVVAVHVASYRRGDLLPDLFAALEAQTMSPTDFEVVVVDDASDDSTWETLRTLVEATPLAARAIRLAVNSGPATARNTAVEWSRADVIAFTDDDCLPAPAWLAELTAALGRDGDVVQGRVVPPDDEWATSGPWDHTIRVSAPTPFFETCNIAYRRADFEAVGGFDTTDPLLHPGPGQHFGEDAVLGAAVVARGATHGFAPDAVVYHRCERRSFVDHLRAQRKVGGFPGLAARSPVFASRLTLDVFLTRRSAAFDLAVVSVVTAAVSRRRLPLVGVVPWLATARPAVAHRSRDRRDVPRVLAGLAATDLVTAASLVAGSVRHRRLLV